MQIYKVSEWKGTAKNLNHQGCDILDLRYFTTKDAALSYLNGMRACYRKKSETHHITTQGEDYFTFKYHFPIKGAELRHTYGVIKVYVEES